MTEQRSLTLEVLSGPLDGAAITLESDTDWGRTGGGLLAFPWDTELGAPQARFTVEESHWHLEGLDAPHGTYRLNRDEKVEDQVQLERGDLLKASHTWLIVHQA